MTTATRREMTADRKQNISGEKKGISCNHNYYGSHRLLFYQCSVGSYPEPPYTIQKGSRNKSDNYRPVILVICKLLES